MSVGLIRDFVFGTTKVNYMEVGFNEGEAEALSWIAQQKAKGKFFGATSGLFLALTWGHWHHRILAYFKMNFSMRFTQLGIIMASILISDYIWTGRRRGANELFANNFFLNNNLFIKNLDSLIDNFDVLDRKFTEEEIEAFNFKRKLLRTKHHQIKDKKWIYNDIIYTPESFAKRIEQATKAPWLKADIKGPSNLKNIVDEQGEKLGIQRKWYFGWSTLH